MTRLERIKKEKAKNHQLNCFLGAVMMGFLAGVILATTLLRAKKEIPEKPVVQEVKAEEPKRFCGDPISYIRCKGEDLGVSNQDIMTMIRIAKCESGIRENAYNKNRNGTIDGGVFQINSIHKVPLKYVFDYEYNIDFAYKLYLAQGFGPWSASKRCWNK